MNAVSGIFVALALMFGGGYAMNRIYVTVKQVAVERIQRGQPSLSAFTNQLTCSKISNSGNLARFRCKAVSGIPSLTDMHKSISGKE